ncbi:putative nucleic acid-binding protein [Rhodopseudomonas rhenobacensis]|uniref:Putative nucleic acid-binding protein n=1 Tax=Rhodopseudomonas rhenobacensis TaxID=87461 RepID=A0A7W8DYX9_9BRAD|nr:type II toxin-antitoxin system VapC family toxin [Rhodopseudomonas rhenobacensis]MBB5047779.1 putative nucleic acid-binding protein [Rhodopseudomonas rhenobacensis]
MIVLDASMAIAWLLNESSFSDEGFNELIATESIVVPAHWSAEVANALLVNLRRKRISEETLAAVVGDLGALDISVQSAVSTGRLSDLIGFAHRHGLTSYDAAYVELALERSARLATLDQQMRRAAATLEIPLIPKAGI